MNPENEPSKALDDHQPTTGLPEKGTPQNRRKSSMGWLPLKRTNAAKQMLSEGNADANDVAYFIAALEHDEAASRGDDSSLIALAAIGVAFMAFGPAEWWTYFGGGFVTFVSVAGFLLSISWRRGRTTALLRLYDARAK